MAKKAHRLEIVSKIKDSRASTFVKKVNSFGFKINNSAIVDVYTINKDFRKEALDKISDLLINPVTEEARIDSATKIRSFNWALEIGFLPGVTDNVANTLKEEIEDLFKIKFGNDEGVYSSILYLIDGNLKREKLQEISLVVHNPLIQRAQIKSRSEYLKEGGMGISIPVVKLSEQKVAYVDLNLPALELAKIGKQGIENEDGTRRGPLALDLPSLTAIKKYFNKKGRKPTDIELEAIAQTWSEHCKHTIFAAKFDDIKDGLYKGFIKKATQEIRKKRGTGDICVSVFTDNSGAITFDDHYFVTDKVETHNSPSALDPFGGAITGIVGVNRDAIGFGKGAKPIINRYGFCFADPKDNRPLYKVEGKQQKILSPRKIMEGVIEGVNVGGNCSGIPTPQGFVYFNERYRGKPLVFVGTVGLIPRKINGKLSSEKKAKKGDYIVVIGGRVGADGIHGATFSSEAMDFGSPATAVQIGDPITQKKLSDAVVKEARDAGLYNSITDNGAGGLSCSVAEMAKESNGCLVELDKAPLKYPGLAPWEIWVSESQERMTLSVPGNKWKDFADLMARRGVEAKIIGKFTDSGRCVVQYRGKVVLDIDMDFLHNGLPEKKLTSKYTKIKYDEPKATSPKNLNKTLNEMLKRLNLTSFEFISTQYDHEVQGGSVIKPLQGKGRVNGAATVTRPLLSSKKGVVLSQALYPAYSEIDTYHMAACSIDTAIRNAISVGGNLKQLALLDNFCWCSSDEEERLGQLKAAVEACYDYSKIYRTPFISGKDSMFNDFVGYDEKDKKIKISVPPTLLVSSIGVVDDSSKTVDMAFKKPGDLIYLVGKTREELGGSEYFAFLGEATRKKPFIGNSVPKVDAKEARATYEKVTSAIEGGLVASSISVVNGGVGIALAKKSISSGFGLEANLKKMNTAVKRDDYLLFSESQSRLILTVSPENKIKFEKKLNGVEIALIGTVRDDSRFVIFGLSGKEVVNENVANLEKSYKETLKDY